EFQAAVGALEPQGIHEGAAELRGEGVVVLSQNKLNTARDVLCGQRGNGITKRLGVSGRRRRRVEERLEFPGSSRSPAGRRCQAECDEPSGRNRLAYKLVHGFSSLAGVTR